ncbi:ribosome biogenesis GTPase Der, partial [Bifidobacterium pseudocatenulatum]|nr:ribosome biogenesis GTPase Der [Bifidobacterium pseudocatenulatum]
HFDISVDPDDSKVYADGEDISDVIRSSEVSSHVSKVSNIIPVRHVLIAAQRAYIAREAASDSFSEGAGVVAEGRDITTVVAPDAEVRVLLTAREEVRQARRSGQSTDGVGSENVAARDAADSKVTNFTSAAEGVLTVDNSDLNFGETLDVLVRIVDDAIEEQQYRQYASNLDDYELDEGDEGLIDGSSFVGGERRSGPKPVGVLAVVGRPNVGKSTLVNRILGRRAAVVEDTPGVTRDRVSYDAEWAGTDFKLVDTGGWEADVEGIESAIASQAQIAVQLADAVVLVVDGQVGLTNTDERIVKMLRASGKPVTLAVNKVDDRESEYLTAEFWKMGLGEPYGISAMHGRGIGELLDAALDSLKKAEKTSGFLTPSHLRRVALVGRPNVGKSSLLNQLAHEERTVVNDLAGTTRDPVDEVVTVDGEDWLFIDTAGIKRRLHKLSGAEYFSSLRTQAAIERSELALVLFDASQPISDQDLKVMSQAVDAGRCIVLVFNKWDLMDDFDRQRMERLWKTEFDRVTWAQRVNLSAKTGWHTNRLARAMRGAL